jgi:dTMP kinase
LKNKFIVIEGIDGSGKTTFAQAMLKNPNYLEKILNVELDPLTYTKEPTRDGIKRILCNPNVSPGGKLMLIELDRLEHCVQMKKDLAETHILCDRYYFSTLAYQLKDNREYMLEKFFSYANDEDLLQPDLVIYLDCGYQLACDRVSLRAIKEGKSIDYYEKKENLKKIQEAYQFLWSVVDVPLIRINTNSRELCLA